MTHIIKNPNELRAWLKGRKATNLRTYSNAHKRTIVFADISKSSYIVVDLCDIKSNKTALKIYGKINTLSRNDGAMIAGWLEMIATI